MDDDFNPKHSKKRRGDDDENEMEEKNNDPLSETDELGGLDDELLEDDTLDMDLYDDDSGMI